MLFTSDRIEQLKAVRKEQHEEHLVREQGSNSKLNIKAPRRVISKVRKPTCHK